MTPSQQLAVVSAPVIGIALWWAFRRSRQLVGLVSLLWVVWRMKRRIKRAPEVDDALGDKLLRDLDDLQRKLTDLTEN